MVKDGKYTTEFYVKVVTMVLGFALTALAFYGVLSEEEEALWREGLIMLVPVLVTLILGWSSNNYTDNRTALKLQAVEAQREATQLEAMQPAAAPAWHGAELPPGAQVLSVEVTNADGDVMKWLFEDEDGER